ncbi:hypothetical protein DSM106972_081870 [Dulcicalothrix desertica PCC 7102]|uniref:Uncharacterized protein n=1 Tax=Dulcicalothrix desertica PCC 7102 TaxID=232991 RepID=A0A3S1C6S8_9CYAN|nr:hypothetical protein [Dulcicalothrix desertica]RUS97968.1 hypothetical protein DSM106972_081870 [Dulcicalothrix desertica PCC 7102]TWH54458.1 hypothetical protein CAL7102_02497 [Dulcicalothrix desertica PCC 7102]
MSQSQPDRLDRIEATLERVSQQLDNQVVVNAELRQRTTDIANAVSSLISTANQHQENFMVIVSEIRNMRQDIVELRQDTRSIQSQVLELQNENRRILNRLDSQQ